MRIAVVGAGIMGASTGLACSERGHDVTIFEQFDLNHARGSSHGRSRIVRKAYSDPFYTEIMLEGYPMWQRLQARLLPLAPPRERGLGGEGRPAHHILHETGLLYFGAGGHPDIETQIRGLTGHEVPFDVVSGEEFSVRLPGWIGTPSEQGVFTSDGGWVHAERAVRGSVALAQASGAKHVCEKADISKLLGEFDRVLACAGAWAKSTFGLDVRILQQTFAYLELPEPLIGPVWIEAGPDNVYGFPSEPGTSTMKFGVHSDGPEVDPDAPRPPADPRHIEVLHDFARRRLGIADPVLSEITTCLYTRTDDEDFRWGQFAPNGYFASPCSGHGFKFGPWIGARLADFAEELARPEDWPRFHRA